MIEIYVREGCPYCKKVLDGAAALDFVEGEDFQVVDAPPGSPGREVVLRVGGKAQVPFLIDGETNMYESDDIIDYLKKQISPQ